MYFVYNLLTNLIFLLSPVILFFRILKGKEDTKRFKEKFCLYNNNNSLKTIWLHAASVGELMSIIPVIKKLEKTKSIKKIIVTTTTTSSAKVFANFKFKKTIHKFFPLDTFFFSNQFIKIWKPQVAIFVDSEIWPNMFKNLKEKEIPIIVINARITKKSFDRWMMVRSFAEDVFSKISLALPQNLETKRYLKMLGVKKIELAGNLKFYGEKKNISETDPKLNKKLKKFKIWCAGSTHEKEEVIVSNLHKSIKKKRRKLLTIIIPRHVHRSKEIMEKLNNMGLNVFFHSSKKIIPSNTDIYLVDTFGESSKFYNLSNISFLGGSIVNHGGQNPLEAVRLRNYILNGPNIKNFREVYNYLEKNKISYTTYSSLKMQKIILSKIDKKLPIKYSNKIFKYGNKILNTNFLYMNKFLNEIN